MKSFHREKQKDHIVLGAGSTWIVLCASRESNRQMHNPKENYTNHVSGQRGTTIGAAYEIWSRTFSSSLLARLELNIIVGVLKNDMISQGHTDNQIIRMVAK